MEVNSRDLFTDRTIPWWSLWEQLKWQPIIYEFNRDSFQLGCQQMDQFPNELQWFKHDDKMKV